MPLNIIRNDIVKVECDAIVNAANSRLEQGGGVCGAIFEAAGREKLEKACKKLGFCGIGQAVITDGYDLTAKYIIHTVGPVYGNDPENEAKQLYSCYESSLLLAKKKGLSSIAFPLISSGIFGYPKYEALKIATSAIKDFLFENDMQVYIVVYDKDSYDIGKAMFSSVKSYIDERLVRIDERRILKPQFLNSTDSCPIDEGAVRYSFAPSSAMGAKKRSLSELIERKTETFSEMLLRLIDEKGMTDVEVYKRANIDRKLFSKIRKKDYTPKKITAIALAIALRLNMDEAKDLLSRAGFAFSQCSRFDIIIEYFIENGNYDIYEINETLFAFDEQLLGA